MKIISLKCEEIITPEEDLSSCRFAEVTPKLRGRILDEPEFSNAFYRSCKSCEVFNLNKCQRFFLKENSNEIYRLFQSFGEADTEDRPPSAK